MQSSDILQLIDTIATLIVGLIGFYFAYNYRNQIRQKTTEGRIDAYEKLWEITKVATPMRKNKWHEGEDHDIITLEERKALYTVMTDWYYKNGNGIFLGDSTRQMYLSAKHNLLCPDDELKPTELSKQLNANSKNEEHRSDLSIRQFSLLRHRMRMDLAVYGTGFFEEINKDDKLFLEYCGEDWRRKRWRTKKS